jgi:hypothetical protein
MKRVVALLPVLIAFQAGAPPALAWTWPVDGPVLEPFSLGDDPYAAGQHRGIDVAAPAGSPVRTPAAGSVSFAGTVPRAGRTVTVRTDDGYSVTLVHLGEIVVTQSARVAEGTRVGVVGPSGEAEHQQPYVHLGIRITSDPNGYLDPLRFLSSRESGPPAAPDPAEEQPPAEGPAPAPTPAPVVVPEPVAVPAPAVPTATPPAPDQPPAEGPAPAPTPTPVAVPDPVVVPAPAVPPATPPAPDQPPLTPAAAGVSDGRTGSASRRVPQAVEDGARPVAAAPSLLDRAPEAPGAAPARQAGDSRPVERGAPTARRSLEPGGRLAVDAPSADASARPGRHLGSGEASRAPATATVALGATLAALAAFVAVALAVRRRQLGDAAPAHAAAPVLLDPSGGPAEDAARARPAEDDRLVPHGDLEWIPLRESETLADLDRDDDATQLVEVPDDACRRRATAVVAGPRFHRARPHQSSRRRLERLAAR